MPLILVTGLPSSGKSTTSKIIHDYLQKKLEEESDTRGVKLVSDSDTLDFEGRNVIYSNSNREKELRGILKSEVQRFLSMGEFVILDSSAYIKGFRYELYCISKEVKTQYCVVETPLEAELCWKWNCKLILLNKLTPDGADAGYSKEVFEGLVERYERCSDDNRWDSPLLKISLTNPLDLEKLHQILTKGDPLKPNKCTSNNSTTTTIYRCSNK